MYKDQLLIGKSSFEQENYDVLIYCPRSIEGNIQIPDFIEIISSHAFEKCKKIQQVEFSPDSKLRIIGNSSFSNMDIERINIPVKVTQICDKSFFSLFFFFSENKLNLTSLVIHSPSDVTFGFQAFINSEISELNITYFNETSGAVFLESILLLSIQVHSKTAINLLMLTLNQIHSKTVNHFLV